MCSQKWASPGTSGGSDSDPTRTWVEGGRVGECGETQQRVAASIPLVVRGRGGFGAATAGGQTRAAPGRFLAPTPRPLPPLTSTDAAALSAVGSLTSRQGRELGREINR